MQVAQTILAQLGGRQFVAMTGAKSFLGSPTQLQFRIGSGAKNKINSVRITLDASDTYNVEFFRIWGTSAMKLNGSEGVYADNLREVFTEATGFYCTLRG